MAEEPLKAQYFVTRQKGEMVPVLAVDELPDHIAIAGVPKVMSPFQITGMTCVGSSDLRHLRYTIRTAPELEASDKPSRADLLTARYFVVRANGNMVGLIAMDEMPEHFVVDGVPRVMSAFEIAGMTCVGYSPNRERQHVVEDANDAQFSFSSDYSSGGEYSLGPSSFHDWTDNASLTTSVRTPDLTTPLEAMTDNRPFPSPAPSTSSSVPVSESASPIDRSMPPPTVTGGANNPSVGASSLLGVKEYCSYWLRHGECDYQQQGCLYKHEMPTDADTLRRLGLRDIPKWYREKHALGSYLAAGGSGAAFAGVGLKSAVALGVEDDKKSRLTSNWRPSADRNAFAPPSLHHRRGNTYNPRGSRSAATSGPTSRFPAPRTSLPLVGGKLRSNETLHRRQQFETIRGLNAYEKLDGTRNYDSDTQSKGLPEDDYGDVSASETGHNRRISTSTMMSDIEAIRAQQEAERKAQEDAEYAKICEAGAKKTAVDSTDASKGKRETVRGGKVGSRRPRRGGREYRGKHVVDRSRKTA